MSALRAVDFLLALEPLYIGELKPELDSNGEYHSQKFTIKF